MNRSRCSLQKSDSERIALDFFKKERRQWFVRDSSELLSKIERFFFIQKKTYLYVLTVFHSFPELFLSPLFYVIKRANGSQRSSLSRSFLHFDGIDLLSSLFTKERPWANPSFDHKKWANSQPWVFFMALYCSSLLAIALHIFFFIQKVYTILRYSCFC